jgi:hypothetical protein
MLFYSQDTNVLPSLEGFTMLNDVILSEIK